VLRTGQPGDAPPREIVARYEIDDYRAKTELTFDRLYIVVTTALRTYRLLEQLETRGMKLLESNEDLERFAYVASHDLQTPLRGIISFAQLLQRRLRGKLDAESAGLLELVLKGGHELHLLITDLLDFSRVGRSELSRTGVDLNHVLGSALDKIRATVESRDAQIESGPLPMVEGNATELEQLLRNLIENGIKFQPGARPRIAISSRAAGAFWEIRVSDRGIGIEAPYLERVFEVFHRLHPQDQFPGTGIGLAICRKVAQRHGGTIHAESAPGQGTTMVVRLPARTVR
jgi:signal transduction histidine kinase